MKAGWSVLLILALGLSACKTPEERARETGKAPTVQESEAPKEQAEAPKTEAPAPEAPTAPKPAAPEPEKKPKGQTAPILVRAFIHSINPVKDGDRARFQVIFNIAEVVRGSFPGKQAVIDVSGMRSSFPWVIDDEFEGGEVFIHIKMRRGKAKVLGFSGTVSGAITAYR